MKQRRFSPGDIVVYREFEYTSRPSPEATQITPSPRGEDYVCLVDRIWIVVEEREADMLLVLTRHGERHCVRHDDPKLRRSSLWERIRYRHQFPKPTTLSPDSAHASECAARCRSHASRKVVALEIRHQEG
jgi:hypothetical protein